MIGLAEVLVDAAGADALLFGGFGGGGVVVTGGLEVVGLGAAADVRGVEEGGKLGGDGIEVAGWDHVAGELLANDGGVGGALGVVGVIGGVWDGGGWVVYGEGVCAEVAAEF